MKKIIPSTSILIPDNATCVFEGVLYSTYHWPQSLFDGSTTTFEMLKRRDTVVMIGIDGEQLIIIEEDQPHSGKRVTFPAGSAEQTDNSAIDAAKREMLEETGYNFSEWKLVKVKQPANDIEWFVHIWLASSPISINEQQTDAGERITVKKMSFSEVKNLVMNDNGVLGENRDIFESLETLADLVNLPGFSGLAVDR